MKSLSKTCAEPARHTVRRARPWLGTLVEIRATSRQPVQLETAVNNAFAAIAQVHQLMNFHDAGSEPRRLMNAPCRHKFSVHPWTWCVLAAARGLADASDGAYDFTLCGQWRDLEIHPENQVRLRRRISLDLSGIAKGFAVDAATDVLRTSGIQSAAVNAGGDLRVFGPKPEPLHVRCPNSLGHLLSVGLLSNEAAATSGNYFDRPESSRLRNPYNGQSTLNQDSITVRAPTCLIADGLTKVVAVLGLEKANPVLTVYRATALILHADGRSPSFNLAAHAA